MKKVLSIFNSIFVFCIIIVIIVLMNVYFILNIVGKLVAKENMINMIKNIDIVDVIGEDAKNEIYTSLEEAGIPKDYVDSMLENEEIKEMIGTYVSESFDYLLGSKEVPTLSEEEVSNFLHKSFDVAVKEAENNSIQVNEYLNKEEQQKVHDKIDSYIPQIMEKLPEAEEFISGQIEENEKVNEMQNNMNELQRNLEKFQNIYQKRNAFLISSIVLMILIIALKFSKLKFIGWFIFLGTLCSINFICIASGITFVFNNIITNDIMTFKSIIDPSIKLIESFYWNAFMISFVLTIILIGTKIIIAIYRKKKENKKEVV